MKSANLAPVMRKNTLFIFAFCALAAVASCGGGVKVKPLMSGIKQSVEAISQSAITPEDAEKPVQEVRCEEERLEIPAPLADRSEQILTRVGYTVSYNGTTFQPNWVAWHLTREHLSGTAKRPRKAFHEDEDVPEPRAIDMDYYTSGYDRGHMCPAADNKWSQEAMYQSFLFTNICPQSHGLNTGDWNEMETQCRQWANEYGDIYIVCGPIFYNKKHKTIGRHKIPVPEAFFKVMLCTAGSPKAIGFVYKNEDGDRPKGDYVNSVQQVQRLTGIDFFPSLDDNVEQAVEKNFNLVDWGL